MENNGADIGHRIEQDDFRLDNLKDLVDILRNNRGVFEGFPRETIVAGNMYCPRCGDYRRMSIQCLYHNIRHGMPGKIITDYNLNDLVPSLYSFECVQCDTEFTSIIYKGSDGPELVILQSCRGGLTTPHTSTGVAYYLDQAHRAQSVGAYSAAIVMFRGALEHLLFEHGYKDKMAGPKIKQLEEDKKTGKAPKWALDLNIEFLRIIKDLADGSIHPNDGDITKQSIFDKELIEKVKETFLMLLYLVYEIEYKKQEHLDSLRKKAEVLKK